MTDTVSDIETLRSTDHLPVVIVRGDLDTTSSPRLDAAVRALQTDGPSAVVVDLAAVNFLDRAGLDVLIQLHRQLRTTGVQLIVQAPSRTTTVVFQLTGTSQLFNLPES